MRVRALSSFVDENDRREEGEEWELEDSIATERIKSGLVVRAPDVVEAAVKAEPETAVRHHVRRSKDARKPRRKRK